MTDPFKVDLAELDLPGLLDLQHELSDLRTAALARGREVQAEFDARAVALDERHRAETSLLGQVDHPPAQHVFGGADE